MYNRDMCVDEASMEKRGVYMANENSENLLIEQPTIALFGELGYRTLNASSERNRLGPKSMLGRETLEEVVLERELAKALQRLNPTLSQEALRLANDELTRSRAMLTIEYASREVYKLLKDGVPVKYVNDEGDEVEELVRVIDWQEPTNNDFLLVSQLTILGELYTRRPDLIGFVNGLPLVFCELKTAHRPVEDAYNDNLTDYKKTIPQLFWYNALVILSNGRKSLLGSITAELPHFFEWKRIEEEDETPTIALETMIRGTCDKRRLLDIVENFTLFSEASGKLTKILARNHQYLGVNNVIEAVHGIRNNHGRLGVFWHTQGSGKSYSMIFFSQKVLRKIQDNWTFVIVTDRNDLDNQIYKNFADSGTITEPEEAVRAADGEHLKELLRADHRVIFTLIQKFRVEKGETYPELSTRSNIIVMTDEAHRSQYDALARNMRTALPHAAFIGFTGTPLMSESEEQTREVFGDYVSVYNFRDSIEDGTTVPLYYENRIPEVEFINTSFNDEMERVIEEAELDEQQEQRLQREFVREYQIITSDDRLEKVAEDIVKQFMGRGRLTEDKAMVVSIDKITTVRMYDKVQKYWQRYRDDLEAQLGRSNDPADRGVLAAKIAYMNDTDMAVMISPSQNEDTIFAKRGLDILPHRRRIVKEPLETKFKDSKDSLRIVFVCAMWITGFDVPSLSTIYLDKPMRNHTLMQAIARANRVFLDKPNGLIVDYVGIFRNLQKALAIYGSESGGGVAEGDLPVQDKEELVGLLKQQMTDLVVYCQQQGFDPLSVIQQQGFQRVPWLDDAEDAMLQNDDVKRDFMTRARLVMQLYKAILPHPQANDYKALYDIFASLVVVIRKHTTNQEDLVSVMAEVEKLVDASIMARRYVIREYKEASSEYATGQYLDLSKIDFEALREKFETAHKHTEAEKLRTAIASKLKDMIKLNKGRIDYQQKFERIIEDYNSGSSNTTEYYQQLLDFIHDGLQPEEQRHITEHLTEEELTVFDMLMESEINGVDLTDQEKEQVKKVVRDLLATLKREKLVLDWRKKQQAKAAVSNTIRATLRSQLPPAYSPELREMKWHELFHHIQEAYEGEGKSIYAA